MQRSACCWTGMCWVSSYFQSSPVLRESICPSVCVWHLHVLSQHLAQVCSSDGNGHLAASDHPEPIRLDADMSSSCGRCFLPCTFNCAGNHTWTSLCSAAFRRVRLVIRADRRWWLSSETASVNKYADLLETCFLESTFCKAIVAPSLCA